jgi:type I restriction enzyme S subunit
VTAVIPAQAGIQIVILDTRLRGCDDGHDTLRPMNISQLLLEHFDHLLATPDSVERLNQAILDLAVRGKLVPQDPTDEPASEVLRRIEAEKAQLIEDGQIPAREKLSAAGADEKAFPLPDGWTWARLGNLALNIHYGYTASADFGSSECRLLRITDIQDSRVDWNSVPGCDISPNDTQKYLLHENDILIARTGGTIGKSYLVRNLTVQAVFASYLIRVIPSEHISPEYAKVFLDSPMYWKQLFEQSKGTGQPNVNATALNQLVLTLPPLAEQHRIVARVEQLFAQTRQLAELLSKAQTDLTHLNEAALHHLLTADTPDDFNAQWDFIAEHFDLLYSEPDYIASLRKAILELAVRGKLTRQDSSDEPASELLKRIRAEKERLIEEGKIKEPKLLSPIQHNENLFELPSGWTWCRIGDVGEAISNAVVDGPFGSSLKLSDYDDAGEYPVISITNIDEGFDLGKLRKLNQSKFEQLKRSAVYPGDVLVAKIGSSWGKAGFYPTEMPIGIIPANLLKITVNHHLSRMYVFFFLRCQSQRNQLEKLVKYTAQPAFNVTAFKNLLFPLPPFAEQQRIVARVEQLLGLCDALEAKLQAAQVEREKLVAAVVAGVSEPSSQISAPNRAHRR